MSVDTINDLERRYYLRALPTVDGGTGTGVVAFDGQTANQYQSVSNYGTSTAPGAGAAIATIASGSLPAGYYKITGEGSIDAGVPAAGDRDNIEVRAGAAVLKRLILNPVTSPNPATFEVYRVLDGSTALTLNANGAGTASVVYRGSITATRLA